MLIQRYSQSTLALILFALISGCSGSDSEPASGTTADNMAGGAALAPELPGESTAPAVKRGTIAFSTLTLTNPFFKVISEAMEAEAKVQGYDFVVVSADQDVTRQMAQVEDFIVKRVSAIVLNPCDSKAIGQAIRKANDAGIPVFTNDIKYDGTDGKVICHIATDNLQGGRLAGEAMVRLLGESGGKVAVLHYPDVESCQMRLRGFLEIVEAHNTKNANALIQVVTTLDGRGTRDAGFAVAKDAIEAHPDLTGIFAINDPSAIGARVALEAAGKAEQVKIIGFDGAMEGKQAILDGRIVCDPIQFPDQMGIQTVQMIRAYFDGDDVPPQVLIPSSLYYQEDAKKDPALKSAGPQ